MPLRRSAITTLLAAFLLGLFVAQGEAGEALSRSLDELGCAGVIEAVDSPPADTTCSPANPAGDAGSAVSLDRRPSAIDALSLFTPPAVARPGPTPAPASDPAVETVSRRLARLQRLLV
ncbi:MAG: hypothetical protein KGM43_17080 [Planctomycetota bacterium]|nr:hypothetical protein [Planctomycetota bacterium]